MFNQEASREQLENHNSENEGEEKEAESNYYGESFVLENVDDGKEFVGESEKEWIEAREYGEGEQYFLYRRFDEGTEYASVWGEREGSSEALGEVEETEEEKERRREREELIEVVKQKMVDRLLIKRRNAFLQKKLTEHFRKRKMENAFKVETKIPDLERKYLNRLYAFQEFKKSQESEMQELSTFIENYENETESLEKELEEKLKHFITRAKQVSLNLILTKTGKKLNEKIVDALLTRQVKKNEEKGKEKLQFLQIKNLIEEIESQIKALEYFGDGLHIVEYEQLNFGNQNFIHKIEEKEDELTKMRSKTEEIMQSLAHIREKSYALEDAIEVMEEEVYDVEKKFSEVSRKQTAKKFREEEKALKKTKFFIPFNATVSAPSTVYETRERLTEKRIKRDSIREQCARLKAASGLLTKNDLLRDFERSIYETKVLTKELEKMKKAMHKKDVELHNVTLLAFSDLSLPQKRL